MIAPFPLSTPPPAGSPWLGLCLLAVLAGAAIGLSACTTNPATGRQSFTGFMSSEEELKVGREEHPKIVREFGGALANPDVARYVSQVGERLGRSSELPDLNFTFTILNSDIVNAFALPGGYVYVTRGLLALASSEAELAGVLGHEIGHVTARHTAQRYSAAVAGSIGVAVIGILTGSSAVAQAGQAIGELALAGYSREQESEADTLGIHYLARNNYDTGAMASFLAKLQAEGALEAELAGRPGAADQFSLLQSHPRTADRVREAIEEARRAGIHPANPRTGREEYLSAVDGMYWGGDPENGFVRHRLFIHTRLRFQFEVPRSFRVFNGEHNVIARGPNGARVVFDVDSRPQNLGLAMGDYLRSVWAREINLSGLEAIDINGMPAATAAARVVGNSGTIDIRLVAVRFDPRTIYRFIFATRPADTGGLNEAFRRTTYSLRPLDEREARSLRPLKIRIVTLRPQDTVDALARRMAIEEEPRRWFEVLNGLKSGEPLRPGERMKIIAD